MADVTIKNVPEGCEAKVKEMAMVAIERYLKPAVSVEKIETFKTNVAVIRAANTEVEKE